VTRLSIALVLLACAPFGARAQTPTFSARVDGIRVDVQVTDSSRRPLRGLTPSDFEIRDNGVLQTVDVISFGEVPLNVSLAFDLSDSVAGSKLTRLRAASDVLLQRLEPVDQVALVTFNKVISSPCVLRADVGCVRSALAAAQPDGDTALVDGAYAGMLRGESDVGRSLLMVFSDGIDSSSWLSPDQVVDGAKRSDIVAYGIAPASSRPDFLKELAEVTGGGFFAIDDKTDLARTFQSVLDEFRYRYLVTYTPRNVSRDGWHRLEVRVKRDGARVKARPGYQGHR
jgi:Ca-activated chloride channel homolog